MINESRRKLNRYKIMWQDRPWQVFLITEDSTPSFHSPVAKLYSPYSSPSVRALGLIGNTWTSSKPAIFSLWSRLRVAANIFQEVDLAVFVSPRRILEWREFWDRYLQNYNTVWWLVTLYAIPTEFNNLFATRFVQSSLQIFNLKSSENSIKTWFDFLTSNQKGVYELDLA